MYHFTYIIRNLINNKIYYGVHSTNKLNDGYWGSSPYLGKAKKKYGLKNFRKEYVKFFYTRDAAVAEEIRVVTREFINRKDTYNGKVGGLGFASGVDHPFYGLRGENNPNYGKKRPEQSGEKHHFWGVRGEDHPAFGKTGELHPKYGKKQSKEFCKRRSELMSGKNNPRYGKFGEDHPAFGSKQSKESVDSRAKALRDQNPIYTDKSIKIIREGIAASKSWVEISDELAEVGILAKNGKKINQATLSTTAYRMKRLELLPAELEKDSFSVKKNFINKSATTKKQKNPLYSAESFAIINAGRKSEKTWYQIAEKLEQKGFIDLSKYKDQDSAASVIAKIAKAGR
jgi:hypothetical protein